VGFEDQAASYPGTPKLKFHYENNDFSCLNANEPERSGR
jgi:hypothetical protein